MGNTYNNSVETVQYRKEKYSAVNDLLSRTWILIVVYLYECIITACKGVATYILV